MIKFYVISYVVTYAELLFIIFHGLRVIFSKRKEILEK